MVYPTDVDSENEFTLSDTVRDNKKRKVEASKSDMTRDSKSSTLFTEHPSSSSSSSSTEARSTVESTTEEHAETPTTLDRPSFIVNIYK